MTSLMTTTHTPFTSLSPFTCLAPPEAKVASPPKLLKPKKRMQEPLKSPFSPVFYSLFFYVLPIVLTTHMHVRTKCSLSSVSHFFLAMRNNLQKPAHSPSWTWTTLSTCLSPLYPVSSPGLSKFLFTDSLTHLDGQDLTPRTIDFSPLSGLLHFLPHFLPPSVKPLIQHYLFEGQLRYDPACFDYLQSNQFLPGTSSESMSHSYIWDLSWTISFDSPGIKEALELLNHSHPSLCQLFRALGPHFHRSLIHALVAPNGHFPALLNATLWGLRSGHTSLCVQGIFGSGKTYSSSLLLILVTSVLGVRTVLSADPNLPLATAAENISDLLRDSHQSIRSQYARCLAQNIPKTTDIDVLSVDRSSLFQPDSLLRCLLVTQGSILRDATSAHPLFTSFLVLCLLAINDEAQQGGQSGFTILAALLSRFCLQIFTGDREQTRTGTGGDFLKEELLKRLSHKNIGFLGKPNPLLPHELTTSLCTALSLCPNYKDLCPDLPTSPLQLAAALSTHPVPEVYFPKTVHDAEGLQSYPIPNTKGILMHLILPHSLRCPADAYFTQVVSHYPHLHRELDTGELRYGHFEDPLPSIASLRLPVDMQGRTHHISGYRLLNWSPAITQNAHIDRASLDTVLTIAGVLSYFTARSIRLTDENSKLLILAPHNDTIQDLQDALGTPSPHFPPTLYDFYLTCIFRAMLLPTHISAFARRDHMNQLIEPQPHTISSLDIHHYLSTHSDLIHQLLPHATLSNIVHIARSNPQEFSAYCTISNTVRAIGIGGTASIYLSAKVTPFLTQSREAMARNIVALTRSKGLCVLLLPSTQEFRFSFLHTLRTLCAYRHGLYHVGGTPPDLDRLATFLSLPDATFNSEPCIFNQGSWLLTHQISYFGTWDFLPLAMQLSHEGQIYILTLCLRSDLPQPDHWEVSAGHFNWHEYREGPPSLELFLVFGEDCLHLTTGNNNLASFDLSQRNSTPVPLTNNGWTLSPTTGVYFFARSSVSVEHLFPSAPATDDPFRLPRPNVVLWPNQTPAIYSNPLPPTTLSDTHPPPQGLPSSAAVLYQLGLTEMLSPNILLCPALNPYDWMVAYSALTLPHFCTDHLSVLQNPQVLDAFDAKIRQPLLSGQLDAVAAHFIALLPPPPSTFTEQPWILHSKTRKPPASTLPPNDDNIVQDTPSHVAKSPFHLDNIHAAVANLASLLANADDLPKSPKGWIKVAILPTYAGKGVPGNFDSNTQEIVSNGVLTVVSYGIHKPLSENLIAALVAFDNRKRRMRFDIGHFTPGRSQSAQHVIRLSPSSVPHPIGGPGRPSGSSLLAHFPLLPNNALPYAIYFCPAQARQVILRDGIRPKRKSSSSTSAVQSSPVPHPGPFLHRGGTPPSW